MVGHAVGPSVGEEYFRVGRDVAGGTDYLHIPYETATRIGNAVVIDAGGDEEDSTSVVGSSVCFCLGCGEVGVDRSSGAAEGVEPYDLAYEEPVKLQYQAGISRWRGKQTYRQEEYHQLQSSRLVYGRHGTMRKTLLSEKDFDTASVSLL